MMRVRNTATETVKKRLSRASTSVTVTVTRADGARFSRVGYGPSVAARIASAYAQLPPGEYNVDVVSTPGSVYTDIRGRDRMVADHVSTRTTPGMAQFEGKTIVVA